MMYYSLSDAVMNFFYYEYLWFLTNEARSEVPRLLIVAGKVLGHSVTKRNSFAVVWCLFVQG